MSDEKNSKDLDRKTHAEKCETVTKSQCKEIYNQSDLKLKDAEKTIANKDVIIKMLQEHVKKLEESFKQNLKETEQFRYKYCVASEQIRRLRALKKCNARSHEICTVQRPQETCSKEDLRYQTPPKETSDCPLAKCCCGEQLQKIENFLKTQKELLQQLLEKKDFQNDSNKECAEKMAKLQQEIDQLKEENLKLLDQIDQQTDPLIPKVKDSILETYRKTNEQLQRKVSQLTELSSKAGVLIADDEDCSSEDDISAKRVSFTKKHSVTVSTNASKDRSSLRVIKEEEKDKIIKTLEAESVAGSVEIASVRQIHTFVEDTDTNETANGDEFDETEQKNIENEEESKIQHKFCQCDIENKKDSISMNTAKKEDVTFSSIECNESSPGSDNKSTQSDSNISKDEVEVNAEKEEESKQTSVVSVPNINDLTEKLNSIGDRVTELLDKQTNTYRDMEILKNEITESGNTTKECTRNVLQLNEKIDEQNQTFLNNFHEHQIKTDNLTQVNDKIQQELSELKAKIETLFVKTDDIKDNLEEEKVDGLKTISDDDVITLVKCKEQIKNEEIDNHNDDSLKSIGMPTLQKDNALDKQNNNAHALDEYTALRKQCDILEEEHEQKCEKIKCMYDLISFYNKISTEVLALNDQLCVDKNPTGGICCGTYLDRVKSENLKLKSTISSVICHLNEKMSELKDRQSKKEGTSSVCTCTEGMEELPNGQESPQDDKTVLQKEEEICHKELEIEDIYNAVRNTCPANKPSSECSYKDKPSYTCTCPEPPSQLSNIEDIYASILCMCRSGNYKPLTVRSSELVCDHFCNTFAQCSDAPKDNNRKNCEVQVCGEVEELVSVASTCKAGDQCLVSNLENYVSYLYEQLNIISCIENRIEDLRCHIKKP